MSKDKFTNRLINEKSPYLLQHAHNPVDWFPWGEEAFQAAKQQDKPIFLSIGYSTCHWCHVMEDESFSDLQVAKMMNAAFVNVKVDREELPEVDSLYMEFAQSMMSGAAGWPLNVILTPDLRPFFAATYLPKESERGMFGLKELITRIQGVWQGDERERVVSQAEKVVEVFGESVHSSGDSLPGDAFIEEAIDLSFKMADPVFGGMKGIPKFPLGYQVNLFLRYAAIHQDSRAQFLAEKTLEMMYRGGIYDHLGGGFSRYSVDEEWLIPHFEKMLYDNSILIFSYTEAWQATKNPLYKQVVFDCIQYIKRELTADQGGFYSAEDADSQGVEGLFYTWTKEEIKGLLGAKAGNEFSKIYGVTPKGNFEGRNVLHISQPIKQFADEQRIDPEVLQTRLQKEKKILFEEREKRPHPLKDDKILVAPNGLMIHALAHAGAAFQEESILQMAVKAAQFIQNHLFQEGRLLRRYRDGQADFEAGLDEYAFYIRGLIALFEVGLGTRYLTFAIQLSHILSSTFKEPAGAFYQTNGQDPHLILRRCQFADGAEPSANAVHAENLLKLYQLTGDREFLNQAEDIFRAVKKMFEMYPPGYIYHIMNLLYYYDKQAPLFVIALNQKQDLKKEISEALFTTFRPHRSVIWLQEKDHALLETVPFLTNQTPKEGKTTLYLCTNQVCQQPINDLDEMRRVIMGR